MPGFGVGYGLSTLVWTIAIIVFIGMIWRARKDYVPGTRMVLKTFRVNEDPAAKVCVEIVGRASGIVSWVLTLLQLSPETKLRVTNSEAAITTASLSGIQHTYVPLEKITATVCGYQRSILALGFAMLFSLGFVLNLLSGFLSGNRNEIGSDMGLAFGFLILAAIAALVYITSKRIQISFESLHRHGVTFKRSVIENVSVDLPEAHRVIAVFNARILAVQIGHALGGDGGLPPPPKVAPISPGGQGPRGCPKCSAVNPVDAGFCENCGAALPA